MKKVFAILLALTMLLAMAVPAMAQNVNVSTGNGTITISNAAKGETYTIYKLFDATVTETEGGSIAYTGNIPSDLSAYFTKDSADNILTTDAAWKDPATKTEMSEGLRTALAEWAATQTEGASATSDGTALNFDNVDYGYYVVTTTQGEQAITVDSTNPTVTIIDKNQTGSTPVNDNLKNIVNSDGTLTQVNSASIGETVNFEIKFNATNYEGTTAKTEYRVTDILGKGFTLDESSWIVTVQGQTESVATPLAKDTDYFVSYATSLTTGERTCVIRIPWQENGSFKYDARAVVTITYSATVNENADPEDLTTLQNTANVDDKNENTTTTNIYYFDLVKTGSDNVVINGAKFKLYSAQTGGTEIPVVADGDGQYHVDMNRETGDDIEAGEARITGLAADTYWLQETEAPAGYNKLTARVKVEITDANLEAIVVDINEMHDHEQVVIGREWKDGGIHVINNAGSELPATGGIGTTIFYVVGGLLMAAAVVLLVTKKKVASGK